MSKLVWRWKGTLNRVNLSKPYAWSVEPPTLEEIDHAESEFRRMADLFSGECDRDSFTIRYSVPTLDYILPLILRRAHVDNRGLIQQAVGILIPESIPDYTLSEKIVVDMGDKITKQNLEDTNYNEQNEYEKALLRLFALRKKHIVTRLNTDGKVLSQDVNGVISKWRSLSTRSFTNTHTFTNGCAYISRFSITFLYVISGVQDVDSIRFTFNGDTVLQVDVHGDRLLVDGEEQEWKTRDENKIVVYFPVNLMATLLSSFQVFIDGVITTDVKMEVHGILLDVFDEFAKSMRSCNYYRVRDDKYLLFAHGLLTVQSTEEVAKKYKDIVTHVCTPDQYYIPKGYNVVRLSSCVRDGGFSKEDMRAIEAFDIDYVKVVPEGDEFGWTGWDPCKRYYIRDEDNMEWLELMEEFTGRELTYYFLPCLTWHDVPGSVERSYVEKLHKALEVMYELY